jgi:RNA polymerase sigma-70 factor, ECF subfamily
MVSAIFMFEKGDCGRTWVLPNTLRAPNPHPLHSTIVREDEPVLVASARSGDSTAFDELLNRYEDKIFRLARNITGNREDAEDAMQDAFLKAFTHLNDFHGESRFYTWLVRIAANEALMRLRKRRPNQFSLDEPIQGETDLLPRELEDWEPNPEQKYADAEISAILSELMEQIDPEFRIVLVLRDVEELSTQETAEALGISKSAVKSRLLRGRLKLRDKLNRYFRRGAPN